MPSHVIVPPRTVTIRTLWLSPFVKNHLKRRSFFVTSFLNSLADSLFLLPSATKIEKKRYVLLTNHTFDDNLPHRLHLSCRGRFPSGKFYVALQVRSKTPCGVPPRGITTHTIWLSFYKKIPSPAFALKCHLSRSERLYFGCG